MDPNAFNIVFCEFCIILAYYKFENEAIHKQKLMILNNENKSSDFVALSETNKYEALYKIFEFLSHFENFRLQRR